MNRLLQAPLGALLLLSCALNVSAHGDGDHSQIVVAPDADWATRHMAEEHHISGFDATTFFNLHDYDSTGIWTDLDIQRTYGLIDPSSSHISTVKKTMVVQTVLKMFDTNRDGAISLAEYLQKDAENVKLPDFGMGPGHHGDDEYEYEIHHWEKYHSGDDVKEEDLNHPEDIAHFKHHEELEARQEEWERLEKTGIVERNIPAKYRRN
ncbi:secretory pathway protein-like protein Ssp120 [Dothidotthia symphoricarpi CBS 119687]|uniref:Secretory pathway protein-like protein Ssp120 n=1 Tax=Dothidotthia symphoricarpi CBS 119687 TaxID=1392245 RepID=A0A6A6ACU0_9PLEO|nr:secretory pathway protein-like protein Ssp120 [Dothidotthia symphoricarpi CBS 119687]KAF2129639.1 secretory pathway protein-like protein Ssp120 [Dothidotthia symphoricarpi CBS 119687]